jgi:protease IV
MDLTAPVRKLRPPLVLALDLSVPVTDEPAPSPLARLTTTRGPDLREVVEAITAAADDAHIRALVVRVDAPAASWAHAEELRAAVSAFRRAGKRAVASAQTFGEAGDGTLAYYVATSFDEIHLQPTGEVGITGPAVEVPFVAGLLDKLDVTAQVDHRHEYKSASNLLTEREFTEPHREAADRIIASQHEQLVDAIALGRGLTGEEAAAVVDRGPRHAEEALRSGLVDRLTYRDETVADVKERAGDGARLVTLKAYRTVLRRRQLLAGMPPRRPTRVALIHGHGAIHVGVSRRSPMGARMGSDTVVQGFQQAITDKRVRAILFRVDSPGGSGVASDAVRRAVERAREAGKPVIVSMGSVAGSGGYWVSMDADRIIASPGTLTGSIGVVVGKLVTRGLKERLGITTDEAHRGGFALMFSTNREFTSQQWDRVQSLLDRFYDEFVGKVAQARGMSREQVHEVARGRVWTGADAAANGLVDELGGYTEAWAAVRRRLELDSRAPLTVRSLPRQSPLERLGLRQPEFEEARALIAAAGRELRAAGLRADGLAVMPDWTARLR